MSLMDNLKPRQSTDEITIRAFSTDVNIFKKFMEFLNKEQEEGQFLEEDVFSHLLGQLKDVPGFNDYLHGTIKKKRGRKKQSEKIEKSIRSAEKEKVQATIQ